MAPNTIGCSRPKQQKRINQVRHLNICDRCAHPPVCCLSSQICQSGCGSLTGTFFYSAGLCCWLYSSGPESLPSSDSLFKASVRYRNSSSFHPQERSLLLHLSLGFLTIRGTVRASLQHLGITLT